MINRVTLQGRLTRDPELRTTKNGISACSVTVAWSERRGENESKLFLTVNAWRASAETLAKYFEKGQEIIVEGWLQQREWTDNNGKKRQVIEMQAERIHFCGPKKESVSNSTATYGEQAPNFEENVDDDDLPF